MFNKNILVQCFASGKVFSYLLCLFLCIECVHGRKFNNSSAKYNRAYNKFANVSDTEKSRGFFSGGIFSLGKVLNFFPVGGERECQPVGHTLARAGICLNPYDCRQREGQAAGDCAHGLGVCCVFEVTCGGVVQNNLTYFMSPGFPELWYGDKDCDITVEKTHAGIMQLRIDFVHFTIGQPNRTTGECDEDALIIGEGASNFTVCGQNHGQHLYYNLPTKSVTREAGDLPATASTRVSLRTRGSDTPRLWMLRLAQMPLAHAAPHDCLQHYTDTNGTIKTFNYAVNGRHLASHDYRACVRRNKGSCAIRYWPCDSRSFRVGPSSDAPAVVDPVDTPQMGEMPADQTQDDTIEGSGADPQIEATPTPAPSLATRRRARMWARWSPYVQHLGADGGTRYYGYGNYGMGLLGHGRLRCTDRVTIPCESEYFVASSFMSTGVCDPHHCGSSFCAGVGTLDAAHAQMPCHVDSSISPFAVSVHFGPPTRKRDPEENIGMCLRYTQLPCNS